MRTIERTRNYEPLNAFHSASFSSVNFPAARFRGGPFPRA